VLRNAAFLLVWFLSTQSAGLAQMPPADRRDVGTIESIVTAFYEVINGPAGTPRQWRRGSTLYMSRATFIGMTEKDGRPVPEVMTPEEFDEPSTPSS
jgi:hypothetical protein